MNGQKIGQAKEALRLFFCRPVPKLTNEEGVSEFSSTAGRKRAGVAKQIHQRRAAYSPLPRYWTTALNLPRRWTIAYSPTDRTQSISQLSYKHRDHGFGPCLGGGQGGLVSVPTRRGRSANIRGTFKHLTHQAKLTQQAHATRPVPAVRPRTALAVKSPACKDVELRARDGLENKMGDIYSLASIDELTGLHLASTVLLPRLLGAVAISGRKLIY